MAPSPSQLNDDAKTPQDFERELEKRLGIIQAHGRQEQSAGVAKELDLPFSDLAAVPVDPEALALINEPSAREGLIAVIARKGTALAAAMVDPRLPATAAVLKALEGKGFSVKRVITTKDALETVWKRYELLKHAETFEVGAIDVDAAELDKLQSEITDLSDLKNRVAKISATRLLEILIAGALKTQASDVHFEPEAELVRIRYRLDGLLHDVTTLDTPLYTKVLNRVKILSKLKLNVHASPQDGRFTIRQTDADIEVRVSVLPSEYGETIVMRLLDPRTIRASLEDLGMREDVLAVVKSQLAKSTGAILTTGPTGSGKTTTLYAFVSFLNSQDTKIITIEDPIEYHIEGISQTQVDAAKEYTFANGLRAIVRQDPDIILVGEIRDQETADIALNASLTGHLVFSTIHTNDAAGTIPRLIDLGIKPQTIAPAINMAMGQRLLRRLCEHCKIKNKPSPEQLAAIKEFLDPITKKFKLPTLDASLEVYFPGKCDECNQLGYKGRVGVYEAFIITRTMEKLILQSPAISDVRDTAVAEGMVTMLQDGYLKLVQGITSLDEIQRVLG